VDLAGAAGVQPRVTSTLRSHSQQAHLYKRYLAGLSRYPAAPPGTSAHEFGYAFDMLVIGDDNQNDLGSVWQAMGGKWGGPNRDPIHFEYPGFSPPGLPATSFLYKAATFGAGLAIPFRASLALSLGEWISENPTLAPAIENLQLLGVPIGSYLDQSLEEILGIFPQWVLDILGL